jgi:hypothetical protein
MKAEVNPGPLTDLGDSVAGQSMNRVNKVDHVFEPSDFDAAGKILSLTKKTMGK